MRFREDGRTFALCDGAVWGRIEEVVDEVVVIGDERNAIHSRGREFQFVNEVLVVGSRVALARSSATSARIGRAGGAGIPAAHGGHDACVALFGRTAALRSWTIALR